jgi:hypothetical protein
MRRARLARISLLLADVDGTLVTHDKVLTERARAAVHRLHEQGIRFAITSGRPPRGMVMLTDPLRIDTAIAAFNGGIFVEPDLTVIDSHPLPPKVSETAVRLVAEHGLDVWVYRGNEWFVRNPDCPHVAREQWTVKFPPTVINDFTGLLDQAVKIVSCGVARRRRKTGSPGSPRRRGRNPITSTSLTCPPTRVASSTICPGISASRPARSPPSGTCRTTS